MSDSDTEVRYVCGCVLVVAEDGADQEHRWWFDETDAGRLVFTQEVIHFNDLDREGSAIDGRHFVPEHEAEVPDNVTGVLEDEGYEMVVDTDGHIIHP